jgi:hypothetical protein
VRAADVLPKSGEPPHGDPRADWDPYHAAFRPKCVDPGNLTIWHDRSAPYGRGLGGVPYTEPEYARRFHILGPDRVAWPPNEGAGPGTKLDYSDAYQFVLDFGDRMDRLGPPNGRFMGLMGNRISVSYEARAIHYESLYEMLHTYTLIPGRLHSGWKIRAMDTAPALGQPGGSLGLIFLDDKGNQVRIYDLIDPRNGILTT